MRYRGKADKDGADMSKHKEPYHPTELESYQYCPEKYFLGKDATIVPNYKHWAMWKGSMFHRMMDRHHDKAADELVWKNEWARCIKEETAHPEFVVQGEPAGEAMYLAYKEMVWFLKEKNIEVLETEKTFMYRIKDMDFSGTVDAVVRMPDTPHGMVELLDYKTGVKWANEAINRKLQFGHYYIAAWQHGMRVNRVFWVHTRDLDRYKKDCKGGKKGERKGDVLYPIYITKDDVPAVVAWTYALVNGIENELRYPNPFALCQMCEYAHACPRYTVGIKKLESTDETLAQQDDNWDALAKEMSDE